MRLRWKLGRGASGVFSWLTVAGVATLSVVIAVVSLASSSASASTARSAGGNQCGVEQSQFAKIPNNDPSGVLKTLSPATQKLYEPWPYPVAPTPWKTFKGVKGPWKIGLIMFPLNSPYNVDMVTEAKKEFAIAKQKGLVKGSLVTYIQPSTETATPEQQISAIQQMVREGVNGIEILPLAGQPLAPAIDAAGKAGVPVVVADNVIPNSKYAINIYSSKEDIAAAKAAGMVKKGNVLIVRGLVGNSVEQPIENGSLAAINSCPGLKLAGQVVGDWSAATAKTAVLSWLTSHPGVNINLVIQNGAMMAGVVEAFQAAGKPVPVIDDGGCQGGDLSWWLANKAKYKTVGTCNNGFQATYTAFHFMFRVLAGDRLKIRDIAVPTPVVTNANVAQFATAGKPLTWEGEPKGPLDSRCGTNTCMNQFFVKPGTPGGF